MEGVTSEGQIDKQTLDRVKKAQVEELPQYEGGYIKTFSKVTLSDHRKLIKEDQA